MAAKLIRQPDQLVLVGVPTSAAAAAAGVERGPAAFRAAGILERLQETGYQVTDPGDLPETLFQEDPESPRARNLKNVLAMLDVLRVRIEQSARAHAFPVVLGGDATIALALVAGLRRQAASLALVHFGRCADLHTPMRTEDGLVEPMTVSHLVGQGAPEMVRFWKDPPLVRQPDIVLFGLGETDEIDRERLGRVAVRRLPLEKIRSQGAQAAAETALDRLRAASRDFVVHLGLDVFSPEEVPGCPRGVAGGLSLAEVTEALNCLAARPSFAGLSVSGYDSALDPEGRGAKAVVDVVVGALAARYAALTRPETEEPEAAPAEAAEATAEPEKEQKPPEAEATPAAPPETEKEKEPAAEAPEAAPDFGATEETADAAPETTEPAQSGPETEASAAASSSESETQNS